MISPLPLLVPVLLGALFGAQSDSVSAGESLLTRPLYLGENPPPVRALNNIVLLHAGVSQDVIRHDSRRTREEALVLAKALIERLRAGEDFAEIARGHSSSANVRHGACLGAYPRGMLVPVLDEFLWSAEVGAISEPLETPVGIQIIQRTEARAGVLQIRLKGEDAEVEIGKLRERILAGEDFGKLAKEHSVDEGSASVDGQYSIFIRGSQDTQLKALAFKLKMGEVSEPFSSPLGWYLIKRVAPDALPASLEERVFVRVRAIVIAWSGCFGASEEVTRDKIRALEVVRNMEERIREGDSMEEFAASRFNDDPTGRARKGDLGWVYRRNPDLPIFMSEVFRVPPGRLLDVQDTSAGYVLLRREK